MMSDFQMYNIRPCKVVLAPLRVDLCYGIAPCRVVLSPLKKINKKRLKKHWTIPKRSTDENQIYLQSKMSDSRDSENESLMRSESSYSENVSSGTKGSFESVKELNAKLRPHRKEVNHTASRKSSRSTIANINLPVKYLPKSGDLSVSESSVSSDSESESLGRSDSSENESWRSDSSENESWRSDSSYENESRVKEKKRKTKQNIVPETLSDYEKNLEIKRQEKFAFLKTLNFNEIKEMCDAAKKLKFKPRKSKRIHSSQNSLRKTVRSTKSNINLCVDYLSRKSIGLRDSESSDSN